MSNFTVLGKVPSLWLMNAAATEQTAAKKEKNIHLSNKNRIKSAQKHIIVRF